MKRKRWTIRLLGGLLLLATLGGCKQQLFMEPGDYQNAIGNVNLAKLESEPHAAIVPPDVKSIAPPATVLDPNRTPVYLTLKQAIALAIEQGNSGGSSLNPGNSNLQLPQFTGRGSSGTDSIQAFKVDPAISAAEIERSLSKFDARWITSMSWNKNDSPTLTLQQSFSNGDSATLSSTIAKPLPTGGVAGIVFSTQYSKLAQPPTNTAFVSLVTSYTPRVQFVFEQPLLQAFGVEINQLLPNHPGSQLIQGFRTTGAGTEGILITRIRSEQQRAEFDRIVNQQLLNVETAYWNLFSAYYNLAAQEEGLKQALDGYQFILARSAGGIARQQLAYQNRAQYFNFRSQVIRARGQVLSTEQALRDLLGMRLDDGTRLVPVDEPILAKYVPNWDEIHRDGVQNRPELLIARQELKARQLDLLTQKNLRKPDLRFFSSYDIAGLGPRLDGANIEDNAFRSLASNQFNSYQLGLRLDMPLGFRDANSLVRQAQLNLKRYALQVLDTERKVGFDVAQRYRQIEEASELIVSTREERISTAKRVENDVELYQKGVTGAGEAAASFVLNLLLAQQQLATATAAEYRAIADYNNALAALEHAKGTIQQYNNVSVADGPLPAHVQKKAADHFAATEAALKLREHPAELPFQPLHQYQPLPNSAMPLQLPTTGTVPGVATPPQTRPWENYQPTAPAPMPLPMNPMTMPPPRTSGTTEASNLRPQLVPADAPGTFNQSGSVTFPSRYRGPASPDPVPASLPTGVSSQPIVTPFPQNR